MSVVILNQPFDYHAAVTLSDTVSNIYGARYIQNVGTAGAVMVRQTQGNAAIYLLQGQTLDTGKSWLGIMSTGTGAGVSIVAFY